MTPAQPPTESLQAALEEYLSASEAGRAPGRDEFLARHPGLARELAAALDAVDAVRSGSAAVTAEWIRQAAEAVAAHAAGVTHRDVKPANLLLEFDRGGRPHVWLHDFGLVVLDDMPADPRSDGTPGYMSPEQRAGEPEVCQPPTNVSALGVTLFEFLTLTKPGGAPPARPSGRRAGPPRATAGRPTRRAAVAAHTLAIDDVLYATPGAIDTQRKLLEQAAEVHQRQVDRDASDRTALRHLAQTEW